MSISRLFNCREDGLDAYSDDGGGDGAWANPLPAIGVKTWADEKLPLGGVGDRLFRKEPKR